MEIVEIPIAQIDVSELNVRKNLHDGEADSGISDLANAIERQTLLSPITVYRVTDGRYALVAGQRRLLAVKLLGWETIPSIVRDSMSDGEAMAVSLVENVHRADMNPRDKAVAFKALFDQLGSYQKVGKETGVGVPTIKKYIHLLDLALELQEKLAAGETNATAALAQLAQTVPHQESQLEVFEKIGGFRQDVQKEILRHMDSDLENLDDLVTQAHEGIFDVKLVRNCPWDCPTIPASMKSRVETLIRHKGQVSTHAT